MASRGCLRRVAWTGEGDGHTSAFSGHADLFSARSSGQSLWYARHCQRRVNNAWNLNRSRYLPTAACCMPTSHRDNQVNLSSLCSSLGSRERHLLDSVESPKLVNPFVGHDPQIGMLIDVTQT